MISQKPRKLAWLMIPVLLGGIALLYLLFLFPQHIKAQSALEFTVTPAEQAIFPGGSASLTIGITNTGPISLTNFVIGADVMPCRQSPIYDPFAFPGTPLVLGIGESYSFTCTEYALNIEIDEAITINAQATDGNSSISDAVPVLIHVEHLSANFGTELMAIPFGDSAQLTLYIANRGTYDLSDISVSPRDAAFSDCFRTAGQLADLAGGASTSFTCWTPNISENTEVVFDVAATLDGSTAVSEVAYMVLDSVNGLTLEISPDSQQIAANTTADLTVTLTNTDSEPVSGISVTSPDFLFCNKTTGTLPDLMGYESYQYQCQSTALAIDKTYTMTASATINSLAVTAVDSTTINAKSMVEIQVQPNYVIVPETTPVTFTLTVTNHLISDTLTNLSVNTTPVTIGRDGDKPSGIPTSCSRALADLSPGAVTTYTCERIAFPGEPEQTFTVSGFSPSALEDADADYHIGTADAYIGLAQLFLPVGMNDYLRPFSYPDLIIDDLTVSQISNSLYSLRIVAKNLSTVPVNVGNNFYINAYLTSDLNTPILVCSVQGQWFGAGQSYTCSGQINLDQGSQIIRAWADPYGTIVEEFDSNNSRDLEVTHE